MWIADLNGRQLDGNDNLFAWMKFIFFWIQSNFRSISIQGHASDGGWKQSQIMHFVCQNFNFDLIFFSNILTTILNYVKKNQKIWYNLLNMTFSILFPFIP